MLRYTRLITSLVFALTILYLSVTTHEAIGAATAGSCTNTTVNSPINVGDPIVVSGTGCSSPNSYLIVDLELLDKDEVYIRDKLGIYVSGDSYTESLPPTSPPEPPGTYYIYVYYDATNADPGEDVVLPLTIQPATSGTCNTTRLGSNTIAVGDSITITGSNCSGNNELDAELWAAGAKSRDLIKNYSFSGPTYSISSTSNEAPGTYEVRVYYNNSQPNASAVLPLTIGSSPGASCNTISFSDTSPEINTSITMQVTGCPASANITGIDIVSANPPYSTITTLPDQSLSAGSTDFSIQFTLSPPQFRENGVYAARMLVNGSQWTQYGTKFTVQAAALGGGNAPQYVAPPKQSSFLSQVQCDKGQTYVGLFDACLDFGTALGMTMSAAIMIGALLAGMKLAIGAIQFIFSTGDPQKLQNARDTLTDAALGLVLLASAWVILKFVQSTLPEEWNIQFLNLYIPGL